MKNEISFIAKLDAIRQKSGLTTEEISIITKYFFIKDKGRGYGISSRTIERLFELDEHKPLTLSQRENISYVLATFYALDLMGLDEVKMYFTDHKIINPFVDNLDYLWTILYEGKMRYQNSKENITTQTEHLTYEYPQNELVVLETVDSMYGNSEPGINEAASSVIEDNEETNRLTLRTNPITIIVVLLIIIISMISILIYQLRLTLKLVESTPAPILSETATVIDHINNDAISITKTCNEQTQDDAPPFLSNQGFSQYMTDDYQNGGILSNEIRKVAINPEGVWVGYLGGNVHGVSLFNGSSWYHCLNLNTGSGNTNDFAFMDDAVLVSIDRLGIARLDNSGWQLYNMGEIDTAVYRFFSNDSDIWIATYGGVAKLVGDNWQLVHQSDPLGLYNNRVHNYFIDSQGFEWFGLIRDGISRYSPSTRQWTRQFISETPLQEIRGIVQREQDDSIWFASSGQGVARYYQNQWSLFNTENSGLNSNLVEDVEVDKYGRIWVATAAGVAFTPDNGLTWIQHSTMPSLDIEFGCAGCPHPYSDDHIWIVLSGNNGLGHVRIPPTSPTLRIISVPQMITLEPGQEHVISIEVEVIGEQLTDLDGDAVYISDPTEVELFSTARLFAVERGVTRTTGMRYTFDNADNPIIAPDAPGDYKLHLRIWQGRRYVTEEIIIDVNVIQ